jgi:tetratricopeptide (TPR) repeat protein
VLVSGEPGIGKTRLIEELAAAGCALGYATLWGRTWEAGGAPPYWPWVEVLRALSGHEGDLPSELKNLVYSRDSTNLIGFSSRTIGETSGSQRFRVFDATSSYLRERARRHPLIIVLEDLHAADPPSLLLLRFLVRRPMHTRLVVIGTYRQAELRANQETADLIIALARDAGQLHLRGLSQGEVGQLIDALLHRVPLPPAPADPHALVQTVYRRTEGNPLFVQELMRVLLAQGPDSVTAANLERLGVPEHVREMIRRHLDVLSRPCRSVLAIGAVMGNELDTAVVGEILDQESRDATGAPLSKLLDEAIKTEILLVPPGAAASYRFAHALLRETIYEEISPSRRAELHRRIAGVIERLRSDRAEAAAEVAHHYYQGSAVGTADGESDASLAKAIEYSVRAGEFALSTVAYEEAARSYERALRALELREVLAPLKPNAVRTGEPASPTSAATESQRCELLLSLGTAQRLAGHLPIAVDTFRRAADLARELIGSGARELADSLLVRAALGVDDSSVETGAVNPRRVQLLEEALARIPEENSSARAVLMARLAIASYPGDPSRAEDVSRRAVAMARRLNNRVALIDCLIRHRFIIQGPEAAGRRADVVNELADLAEIEADDDLRLKVMLWRVFDLLEAGDMARAAPAIDRYASSANKVRIGWHLWFAVVLNAMRAILVGNFERGEQLVLEALAIGERTGVENAAQIFGLQLVILRYLQGRTDEIVGLMKDYVRQHSSMATWRCGLVGVLAESGYNDDAQADLAALSLNRFAAVPRDVQWLIMTAALAVACDRIGDAKRAGVLYELLEPCADLSVVPLGSGVCGVIYYGPVSYHLGVLALTMSRWDLAARHLDHAAHKCLQAGAVPFLAMTRYRQAQLLMRGGAAARAYPEYRNQDPVLLAREALVDACRLGMQRLAKDAETLLDEIEAARADVRGERRPASNEARGTVVEYLFLREGDLWKIGDLGQPALINDLKGLHILHHLLSQPNKHFLAAELTDLVAEHTRSEMNSKDSELGSGLGPGDGVGQVASVEQARINVTRLINRAIRVIAAQHQELAGLLTRTIHTGALCAYRPNPHLSVHWQL